MVLNAIVKLLDKVRGVKRVRTPTRIQMEATECGSTSLMIVLAYYNKYIPAATLRHKCGVTRDGTDAYDLIQAAEYYGLEAEGYIATAEELAHEVDYPAIIHWDSNHFVVLEGIHKNTVYINDPNTGPRKMSLQEFEKHFAGTVLNFEVSDEFEPGGIKPKILRPLLNKVSNLKGPIAAFFSVEFIIVFLGLSFAIFSQLFVDKILPPPSVDWVHLFLWGYLALVISNFAIYWIQGYLLNRMGIKISVSLSTQFFQHLMRLPLSFFHQRHLSEVVRRMNLNVEVASYVAEKIAAAILSVFFVVIYLFVINQYDSTIALLTLGIIGYNLILLLAQNRLRKDIYAKSEQIFAEYSGLTIDAISNIETIRLAGCEPFMFQRIIGTNNSIINASQEIGKKDALIHSINIFSTMLISVLFISVVGWKVLYGSLTAGMFVTLQMLIGFVIQPAKELSSIGLQLPKLKMDLMRIDDVMTNSIDPMVERKEQLGEDIPTYDLTGEVVVENLSFGYQPLEEPLIKQMSFKVNPGEVVGITGPNGSGKSTVMRLVAGQYYPRSGKVLFDGHNIFETPITITQRAVAISEKEALFVKGTIRENLTFWNPHVKDEELIDACQAACIHDIIKARKNGYNSMIVEGAENFSYGQKQRLDIARALLYHPKVLILDESISGLEEELIEKIFSNIRQRVKSMLVISHSEHVLSLCDRVLVISEGVLTDETSNKDIRQ